MLSDSMYQTLAEYQNCAVKKAEEYQNCAVTKATCICILKKRKRKKEEKKKVIERQMRGVGLQNSIKRNRVTLFLFFCIVSLNNFNTKME